MELLWLLFNLLCVWLFTGKWELLDRMLAFAFSIFLTPIIGIPLAKKLCSYLWP